MTDWQPSPEQTRSVDPYTTGIAERDGVRIHYEIYGSGDTTILFVPPWQVVHSRIWKAQIGYFSRRHRVVVYDARGNGKSDRPRHVEAYSERENAADIGAVLDATGTDVAHIVTMSRGAPRTLLFAAEHPERVSKIVFLAPGSRISKVRNDGHAASLTVLGMEDVAEEQLPAIMYFNREAWQRDPEHYRSFLVAFFENFFEPHSTKPIEDCLAWGLDTDPETLALTHLGWQPNREETLELVSKIQCPCLVVHGDDDRTTEFVEGEALAEALGAPLEVVKGSRHGIQVRKPVQVNHAIRAFLEPDFDRDAKPRKKAGGRPKRVLYVSSPIGLGHAQRDVAIARALRERDPDMQIDWLAQDPVTRVLAAEGERIHPASRALANESTHIESESAEHDLHCFHALRRMDEILIHNFMVFDDVMREGDYDVVVGDEAWEIDYYLHENPKAKRAPFVWLTDFVGYVPMEDGGAHEEFLTADYNAEMIGHIADHGDVRDRAIFVGNPEDVVDRRFGPDLPFIRDWTERNFAFAGYVSGFDPKTFGDREGLRDELGFRSGEKVCVVSVGGSGVGTHLLRRVIDAYPLAKKSDPGLRMIVVAGPRIDPASLPQAEGLEIVPYVHNLYRHFAACDLAVVQGGLTTTMELTACKRPFLYFPLAHHFEQNVHVRHRLGNYGAGRCMDYARENPESIAEAMIRELASPAQPRDVETDGAARAAARIAEVF